ncbi:hypothetical protein SYNTR_2274 [Candidatus Syntrophocurvum alkaliphilum]|uniref:HAD family hydrolase n=1 Tax=Candidatus Syntrophocurvum alkaliphilum TaxID=2293317 RepID=A0A6I6DQ83_9FIRM|nr:HAD family hydrolase [Candidatus Syntrophocurvum alkaliphilum]QGU00868.1 hypothetical protein SYNTR_2274 [Candidatus Syntrophocurvum alkaliphilum]
MIKAVTFDFWDTLYKAPTSTDFITKRVNDIKTALINCDFNNIDENNIKDNFKKCWKAAYKRQREEGLDMTPNEQVDFILNKLNIKVNKEQWKTIYHAYTAFLLEKRPELNTDVIKILSSFSEKYKLAVICNTGVTPGVILKEVMKLDDIYKYFDLLVFSNEIGWAKPNVKIFEYTLQNLEVKNTNAIHIGDDTTTDIEGAKRAQMKSIWLAPNAKEPHEDCNYHIQSLRELTNIL